MDDRKVALVLSFVIVVGFVFYFARAQQGYSAWGMDRYGRAVVTTTGVTAIATETSVVTGGAVESTLTVTKSSTYTSTFSYVVVSTSTVPTGTFTQTTTITSSLTTVISSTTTTCTVSTVITETITGPTTTTQTDTDRRDMPDLFFLSLQTTGDYVVLPRREWVIALVVALLLGMYGVGGKRK